MSRKCLSLVVLFILAFSSKTFAYIGQGVIMSDDELDQVYAGGLNFSFDSFLGSVGSTSDNLSKGGISPTGTGNSNTFVMTSDNPNVLVVAPNPPQSPVSSNAAFSPVEPTAPVNPFASVDAISPVSLDATVPQFSPVDSGLAVDPNISTAQLSVPSNSAAPSSPEVASTSVDPSIADVPMSQANAAGVPGSGAPSQSASQSTPNAPTSVDVLASTNGKFQVAVDAKSGITPVAFTNNGGYNSLNVTDTAQQNLSAVVNVNAAGSVVPVQVNLTVLMNSSVENLTNKNELNLSNYSVFQMQ